MNIFRKLFGKRKKEVETIKEVNQEVSTPESTNFSTTPEIEPISTEFEKIRSKNVSFNQDYLVLEDGTVFSTKSNKFLKQIIRGGKAYVSIKHPNTKSRNILLSNLIYCEFNEMDVVDVKVRLTHIDGNNLNCSLNNLKIEWM